MVYSYTYQLLYLGRLLLGIFICLQPAQLQSQVRWDGDAGDGQWTTASNWVANQVPAVTDDVLLDNSLVTGNYTVSLPGSLGTVIIRSVIIVATAGNSIRLLLPASSTATPAFTVTGPGYGISIGAGGHLLNASGAVSAAAISVSDSIRIYNGGQYTHNSRSSHATLVTALSKMPGTEKGIFTFDVPGGSYTIAVTNRTYGTLQLSAAASGGTQVYTSSAASPLVINGDLVIQPGVSLNLDITAPTIVKGNFIQQGGVCNLASQANNNILYIAGDLLQSAGSITETSTGLPSIELNGGSNQNIQVAGNITNSVALRINNSYGITLRSALTLPFQLNLLSGIIHEQTFLLTLLPGCTLLADSGRGNNFVDGRLRKEGLSAAPYFLFPVGKGVAQRWLELKNATGNYTAEYIKSDPHVISNVTGAGVHHISSIEYWTVETDALPAASAAVALSFDDVNSGGVTDLSTLRVATLQGAGWQSAGNTATSGSAGAAGSVVSDPVNSFHAVKDYFALGSSVASQNPLPVQLVTFSNQSDNQFVTLNWIIGKDWQPVLFELRSAPDAVHFTTFFTMNAQPEKQVYQYTFSPGEPGGQYYRLKIIQRNGMDVYSTASRTAAMNGAPLFALRPSVAGSYTKIFVASSTTTTVQLVLYDATGRTVLVKRVSVTPGSNEIFLSLQGMAGGVYTVCIYGLSASAIHRQLVVLP